MNYDGLNADGVTVTITDDDPQMEYSLVDTGPLGEDAGTVQVEVVAVTNEDGVPSIGYAVAVQSEDVTTTAGGDYEAVDETLVFAVADFAAFTDGDGETRYRQSVYFDVVIVDDRFDEDAETLLLKLMESPGYEGSVFGVAQISVSITDDDTASSLTVNFKESGYSVSEGSDVEVVLTLDDDPERTVTIPLSWTNEGGASDSDHNGVPASVTFNSGDTEKSFTFSAVSDRIGDPDEKVSIELGTPPSGVTKGTTSETVVTTRGRGAPGVHVRRFRCGYLCPVRRLDHHRHGGDEPRPGERRDHPDRD